MKSVAIVLLASFVLSFGFESPLWPEQPEGPSRWNYELEALAGIAALALGTGCAVLVGQAAYNATYDPNETGFLNNLDADVAGIAAAGAVGLTLPAWTGTAVDMAGNALDGHGSRGGAVTGAYIGALAGVGVGWIGYRLSEHPESQSGYEPAIRIPVFALGALLIPTGAIWGHDHLYGGGPGVSRSNSRLGLPQVALGCEHGSDGAPLLSVNTQLLSLQF